MYLVLFHLVFEDIDATISESHLSRQSVSPLTLVCNIPEPVAG